MSTLFSPSTNQFLIFVLVLSRLGGLFFTLPFLGSKVIPMRIRALLSFAVALLVTPLYWDEPIDDPGNMLNLGVLVGREVVLGMALGLGILILFAGMQLTGQIIGQMSGMQLADIVNPNTQESASVFSQLLDLITLVAFLTIGGHRQIVQALLDTFQWMPPGQVTISSGIVTALTEVTTQSFILGIRAAAPIMTALLLSILVMGLISRTLPQLNVIAVGFSFNSMIMLVMLSFSLGAAAWLFQDEAENAIQIVRNSILSIPK